MPSWGRAGGSAVVGAVGAEVTAGGEAGVCGCWADTGARLVARQNRTTAAGRSRSARKLDATLRGNLKDVTAFSLE